MNPPNRTNPPPAGVDGGYADPVDDDGAPIPLDDDEAVIVSHEGKRYRMPKTLAPALMRQADYTRKTQILGQQQRALETSRTQGAALDAQSIQLRAAVLGLSQKLAQFAQVNWPAVQAQNPQAAAQLQQQAAQVKQARDVALARLQQTNGAAAAQAQRIRAAQTANAHAVLARHIKGWGPDMGAKLGLVAHKVFGFAPAEVANVTDPRAVKVLHRACIAALAQAQAQAAQKAERIAAVQPTPKVGGAGGGAKGLDDRLSPSEWAKRRNDQVRRRRH